MKRFSDLFQSLFLILSVELNLVCLMVYFLNYAGVFKTEESHAEIIFYMSFVCLTISTVIISVFYFYNQHKKFKMSADLEKELTSIRSDVKYDEDREYLEEKIALLQKQIADDFAHWNESYHLPISAQNKESFESVRYDNFINKFGLKENDFIVDSKMIFMLTPFSSQGNELYLVAKKICSESGLNLYRGDEQHSNNDILDNIIKHIVKSRLVIANINGKNPNVFYELGIAHTLGKPVVLLCEAENEMTNAFDIRQNNTIFYSNWDELDKKLSKELVKIMVSE